VPERDVDGASSGQMVGQHWTELMERRTLIPPLRRARILELLSVAHKERRRRRATDLAR